MSKYMLVQIQYEVETDSKKGTVKKVKEKYLVEAFSPTDAEASIKEQLTGFDYDVIATSESPILQVFNV